LVAAWGRFLEANRPEVVLTYGGGLLSERLRGMARRQGAAAVFGLHNFAYHDRRDFAEVDYVVVPSRFSEGWYRQRLGLACHVLPYTIDPRRVEVGEEGVRSEGAESRGWASSGPASRSTPVAEGQAGRRRYLTFVNPQPAKGLFVFARIAAELARCRPDIPILVVEGRARGRALESTGVDLSGAKNLFGMANTADPRQFYGASKVLVMPSLWNESFGLVAAEAMLNGIPVVVSNRGALPEVVGQGGVVLDIPACYTPETREVPSAEEVRPWVETIVRLWDDGEFYARQSAAARAWSARWRPEVLRPVYESFFGKVRLQPGPPFVAGMPGGSASGG